GFSPLPTPHPRIFQHTWVRASSQCYLTFTLDMGISHGFGSTTAYSSPYLDSLSLRLRVFHLTLHTIVTRRSMLQKVRRHAKIALRLLVGTRFQVLFHPLPGYFSPFPHGTGSLSVTREYLALGDGPPGFQRNVTCSVVLRIHSRGNSFSITGLLPSLASLSRLIHLKNFFITLHGVSYNPRKTSFLVWAISSSLATTMEIAFAFFSSGY